MANTIGAGLLDVKSKPNRTVSAVKRVSRGRKGQVNVYRWALASLSRGHDEIYALGDADTATTRLQAGADPNLKDKKGKTTLAGASGYPYLHAALEKAGARQ